MKQIRINNAIFTIPVCFHRVLPVLLLLCFIGCKKDFLDVVPDNVATVDNSFANKTEAEKFLFTCYSYLPREGNPDMNPAISTGDEVWTYWPMTEDYFSLDPYQIARNQQNKVNPFMDYWDGYDNRSMWQGIRTCNIFLENIDKVPDLAPYLKIRWVDEAKFLKAYYHWYLFRMYGPIPIADVNLPTTATPEQVKVYRQPVDSVVNYIAGLIDQSVEQQEGGGLPDKIINEATELGRITKVAALSIKARVLVTAASPLFNGNTDYASLKNNNGVVLFNQTYDQKKWERAEAACKAAIDAAEAAGVKLYHFDGSLSGADSTIQTEMSIRNAICEKWNSELIWGTTDGGDPSRWMQLFACPEFDPNNITLDLKGKLAPTLRMAELFYTKNGVPIDEDRTWDYAGRYTLKETGAGSDYLQPNYATASLHFDREPRFYADMGFDGSRWYMKNGMFNIQSKLGQYTGKKQSRLYSITGYYTKKVVNWNLVATTSGATIESYPWPIMRLSDLYLLYAEALNEDNKSTQALTYINAIRERAGLKSVESSWSTYSRIPDKYTTKTGLRDIIRQERLIEMAFEGSRFWDIRRWKTASKVLIGAIYGWDIVQDNYEGYNNRVLLFNQKFIAPRDYFWPIKEYDLQINPNLVQNVGW
jgi:hypothetical protein